MIPRGRGSCHTRLLVYNRSWCSDLGKGKVVTIYCGGAGEMREQQDVVADCAMRGADGYAKQRRGEMACWH
jgi:hypothetical protein